MLLLIEYIVIVGGGDFSLNVELFRVKHHVHTYIRFKYGIKYLIAII